MQLHQHVEHVQAQLAATAALGDERTRQTADALVAAAEPAIRLAVLSAVAAAADEVTAALLDSPGAPQVSVRLDADELRIDVRAGETTSGAPQADEPADDGEASARISLRLSESLKGDIDSAARRDGVSVNTWLVRAATRALGRGSHGGHDSPTRHGSHRLTGWVNG